MARFSSALVALAAGILVAFDAASSLAAPLARDATSAPRLEQRRGLLESAAEARAEPELVNIVGAVGEAYQGWGEGGAYFGEAARRRRRDARRLRGDLLGEAGVAYGEAGEALSGRRRR